MNFSGITYIMMAFGVVVLGVFVTLIALVIRALLKYIKSKDVRKEKEATRKSLGEAIKENRARCKIRIGKTIRRLYRACNQLQC